MTEIRPDYYKSGGLEAYNVIIIKKGDRINDLDTGEVYRSPEKLYVILDGNKVIGRYTEEEMKRKVEDEE